MNKDTRILFTQISKLETELEDTQKEPVNNLYIAYIKVELKRLYNLCGRKLEREYLK